MAVLTFGIVFWHHAMAPKQVVPASSILVPPAPLKVPDKLEIPAKASIEARNPVVRAAYSPGIQRKKEISRAAAIARPSRIEEVDYIENQEAIETEFYEYMVSGPDNRSVPVRLPKIIHVQYTPASDEAYIKNVSH